MLNYAAAEALGADPDYFREVEVALTSSAHGPAEIERGWANHANWIRWLYTRKPIFGLEETDLIPLNHIYLPLRGFWHEEATSEGAREDREYRKYRIAHLGDLQGLLQSWLDDKAGHKLRVIVGGPGSGKSSCTRAFANAVIEERSHRVAFLQLQHMNLTSDLAQDITRAMQRLRDEDCPLDAIKLNCDPISNMEHDDTPLLLIFDGLDELSHSDQGQIEVASDFIKRLDSLLNRGSRKPGSIRAIVLGRHAACEAAMGSAGLPLPTLIHVAPILPVDRHARVALTHIRCSKLGVAIP